MTMFAPPTCRAGSALLMLAVAFSLFSGCDQADREEFAFDLSEEFERIGEREGNAYYLSDSTFTWTEAKTRAEEMTDASNGHLVTFSSSDEESFVASRVSAEQFWIGLTDRENEGDWVWITGEPLTYTNWQDEEPNNARGGEDVAAWNESGWNDTLNEEEKQYVIELELEE